MTFFLLFVLLCTVPLLEGHLSWILPSYLDAKTAAPVVFEQSTVRFDQECLKQNLRFAAEFSILQLF